MEAGGGVENQMARWQFDVVQAVSVFDRQFAAVVFFRRREKQRRRQICAHAMRRAGNLTNGVVDVCAERLSALIAVEERRKDLRWSRFFGQQCCLEYKRHDYEKGIIKIKTESGNHGSSPAQI